MKDHSISVDQDRYATYFVAKYLDTSTVKTNTKCYETILPYNMIFTKYYVSNSDEQVDKLTREFNIKYKYCIVWCIYLLSKRVDLSFIVQKLAKFSSNNGKVHF